jgi:mono/diheme cytochrome c family protein
MIFRASLLSLAVFVLASTAVSAADLVAEGRQLLQDNCSRCHAIGTEGDSPHDKAPPFRQVMKVYGADSLQEALAEGLVTGHPDMPEFVFPPEQVGAIIAYLHTLEPKT